MMYYVCNYCGNRFEENKTTTKLVCSECGRVANTQQTVVFTEEADIAEMMPIFGLED